jgi:hypothetical protein
MVIMFKSGQLQNTWPAWNAQPEISCKKIVQIKNRPAICGAASSLTANRSEHRCVASNSFKDSRKIIPARLQRRRQYDKYG